MAQMHDVERTFSPWLAWSRTEEVVALERLVSQELQRRGVAQKMKIYCAWCLKENKSEAEALIGEKEPLEDSTASHGLCGKHRRQVEEELQALKRKLAEAEALRRETERKVDP